VWQVLYEELRGPDFEIIAVALDAGGGEACERSIRPTQAELDARPAVLAPLMGWGEEEWSSSGRPSSCA
jgi:hypothetical protein